MNPGATTISKNIRPPVTGLSTSRSAAANAKSIGRLVATMPPYAEIASPALSARSYSAATPSSPAAKQHGLVCLMIAIAGCSLSATRL